MDQPVKQMRPLLAGGALLVASPTPLYQRPQGGYTWFFTGCVATPLPMLETRLLGTIEIRDGKKPISIPSRPAQSLFAYLVLSAGTAHRREKLAGLLWPDSLEETARENLRHSLWRVRKALPRSPQANYILSDDRTIAFNASADYWLDVEELRKLRADAPAGQLIAVLLAYNGELLPGFYDEWVLLEREHLYSIFEERITRLMFLLESEQRWQDVLHWGERWIKLGQHPEPAYRALMSAHAAQGDVPGMVASYERCANYLRELDLEPSQPTQELYKALKLGRVVQPKTQHIPAAVRSASVPSRIPVPLTSFVGREKELRELSQLLSGCRLLSLVGPGGIGKTRLAIQLANELMREFREGVFWTNLADLSDAGLIPQEIAQALRLSEVAGEPLIETINAHLRGKEALIVLDNCEHLVEPAARTVEQLLAACPKLKIVVTSRQVLGLLNESVWQVPPLPLPEARSVIPPRELHKFGAVRLFQERAQSARPDFALTERNAPAVLEVCTRLDGMPLAIELAAARIRILSVEEIGSRLTDVFSILTAGSRTALPRHQTLRTAIDWSHSLLSEPERILFRRLAVFAGGFTLEAVESVCNQGMKRSQILDLLGRLVDKSLVTVEQAAPSAETRYRLLETIRQYALEKLEGAGETSTTRDQHLAYFIELAEQSEPHIWGSDVTAWARRLDAEVDNFRAAMDWAVGAGQEVGAMRMIGSLVYYWFERDDLISEWHARIQRALASPGGRARTLVRAEALNAIGNFGWAEVFLLDKRPELEEALRIGQELGDPRTIASALRNLGLNATMRGSYTEARALLEQSLETWRTMDSDLKVRTGTSLTLQYLADVALRQDEPAEARSLLEECVHILRELGEKNILGYAVRRLGLLAAREGDYQRATTLTKESLDLNYEIGDWRGVIASLVEFASIAAAQGNYERATLLMAAASTQMNAIRVHLIHMDQLEFEACLAQLQGALDEKTFDKYWAQGQAISAEEATELAHQGF